MVKKVTTILVCLTYLFSSYSVSFAATLNYVYDANGNTTSDGVQCYEYNDANQLQNVKDCTTGNLIEEYVYDFNGTRVVKKIYQSGQLSKTIYSPDTQNETVVEAAGPTTNTTYYEVNGEKVAKKADDGTKTYFLNDHLNSISLAVDEAGQLLEETNYLPYGTILAGGTLSKYLFTGQENDVNTGLYYYGARFYNSTLGRFIQPDSMLPDPHDPQQLNRFAYTRNNPVKYVDPSGKTVEESSLLSDVGKLIEASKLSPAVHTLDSMLTPFRNLDWSEYEQRRLEKEQIYSQFWDNMDWRRTWSSPSEYANDLIWVVGIYTSTISWGTLVYDVSNLKNSPPQYQDYWPDEMELSGVADNASKLGQKVWEETTINEANSLNSYSWQPIQTNISTLKLNGQDTGILQLSSAKKSKVITWQDLLFGTFGSNK